jgi:hypothetical protein
MPASISPSRQHTLPYSTRLPAEPARPRLTLTPEAVARFDALLHELNPDAMRADPDRIRGLAQWLSTLPRAEAEALLDSRLDRAGELGSMLVDSDWDADASLRARAAKLLDYIDRDEDLIDDRTPLFGLLDDALLVDLAWPAFAAEIDDYLDFCAYRRERHLSGVDPRHRAAWLHDRVAEVEGWRRQAARSQEHYARYWMPDGLFRVG